MIVDTAKQEIPLWVENTALWFENISLWVENIALRVENITWEIVAAPVSLTVETDYNYRFLRRNCCGVH